MLNHPISRGVEWFGGESGCQLLAAIVFWGLTFATVMERKSTTVLS